MFFFHHISPFTVANYLISNVVSQNVSGQERHLARVQKGISSLQS